MQGTQLDHDTSRVPGDYCSTHEEARARLARGEEITMQAVDWKLLPREAELVCIVHVQGVAFTRIRLATPDYDAAALARYLRCTKPRLQS